jgi:putative transposase
MPRLARVAPGGYVYHVINRANGRLRLFKNDDDYEAFYRAVELAMQRHPIRLLGWCVMGNHWHFVAWPKQEGQLSRFFGHLSLLHATRWQAAHAAAGMGHVYQSRFKNFMIQTDEHLLAVLRYVERNPLRAGLVKRAQDWGYSSLSARLRGPAEMRGLLSDWPIDRPADWTRLVNRPQTDAEEAQILESIRRGRPFGDERWVMRMAARHNLQSTLRPRGRPKGWRKPKP